MVGKRKISIEDTKRALELVQLGVPKTKVAKQFGISRFWLLELDKQNKAKNMQIDT